MKHRYGFLPAVLTMALLSGCFSTGKDPGDVAFPASWGKHQEPGAQMVEPETLQGWWKNFNDPALTALVDLALENSPDLKIAEARIVEARGERRSAFGGLLPAIGASASTNRGKNRAGDTDSFYEAGFDASYELDLFGRNRKAFSAADSGLKALEARREDVSLILVAEVARAYVDMQGARAQVSIAQGNLEIQQQTLNLVKLLKNAGEAPQLDVERSETLVNTTRASLSEFERQAENAALRLVVLTGHLPEELQPLIAQTRPVPSGNIAPLLAPATLLARRPDIRAAALELKQKTALTEAAAADIFPTISLSSFFGVNDGLSGGSVSVWSVAAGAAVSLLDFGRIRGRIDSAKAREVQAYELYRKTVLQAVTDVESALNDYVQITNRRSAFDQAYKNADRALSLSEHLYKEGEVSFLDVLDVQRTVNNAQSALIEAEVAQAQALMRLYKALSVGL
ncbi:MAG: TolC family protein [Alphaproteobacteria bacterium]|nr:TolC family protein [Alphaproteobacteria bacterium]